MSTYKKGFQSSREDRRYRRFSDSFKLKKVKELEQGRTRVVDICRTYEVSSVSVYRWINKYGTMKKPERTIVESKSDTTKIVALHKRIAELERLLGQKQLEIEYKDKMIEMAEQMYQIDIKKKPKKK